MRLFKYVKPERIADFISGQIRVTQFTAFNDPFEGAAPSSVPFDALELKEIYRAISRKPDMKMSLTEKELEEIATRGFPDLKGRLSDPLASMNDASIFQAKWSREIAAACFSKNFDNILMWSHYADAHRGVVVEFSDEFTSRDGFHDVLYRTDRPTRGATGPQSIREFINYFRVKSADWAYEEEVRMFFHLSKCVDSGKFDANGFPVYTVQLPGNALQSLTLGMRFRSKDVLPALTGLTSPTGKPAFKIYRALPDHELFKMQRNEVTLEELREEFERDSHELR